MATKAQGEPTKEEKYWKRQEEAANRAAKKNGIVEIWKDDSEALAELVRAINANKRIRGQVVDLFLNENNLLLTPRDPKKEQAALQRVVWYQEKLKLEGKPMTITSRDLAKLKKELAQEVNQDELNDGRL